MIKELTKEQREKLLDLMEFIISDGPIPDDYLTDLSVIFKFLNISKDAADVVFHFINLITNDQLCALTRADVVSEELMLDLHCRYGFKQTQLAQWLRGIAFGGFSFFIHEAKKKDVLNLDDIILQSRTSHHMVQGIYIDSVQIKFQDVHKLLEYVLSKRIPFPQYRDILMQMDLNQQMIDKELEWLVSEYDVFSPIRSSGQVLPFRIFCSFFDFFKSKQEYLTGISQVFDQLLSASTVKKTMSLLNDFPYPIISFMIQRYKRFKMTEVLTHLNETLPDFHYGAIRKIVRREQLGLNYKYD